MNILKEFVFKKKEEEKISKSSLYKNFSKIISLKNNLNLISNHEKIFYKFKNYLDYKEANDVFYFETLHPIFNDFFSKFEYVKLDDDDGEFNRNLVCYHPDYDEEYIQIGHEKQTDYIVKKNSIFIDETAWPNYDEDIDYNVFFIISVSIMLSLKTRDDISFEEYKKVLREMEKIPYIKRSVDE